MPARAVACEAGEGALEEVDAEPTSIAWSSCERTGITAATRSIPASASARLTAG